MLNSPFLETIICMVFVFAMLSALASFLHEIQSQYLESRADFLAKAIRRMLSDDTSRRGVPGFIAEILDFVSRGLKLFAFPVMFPYMRWKKTRYADIVRKMARNSDYRTENGLAEKFYENCMIKYMGSINAKKPSYISKESFVTSFLEVCEIKGLPPDVNEMRWLEARELPESVRCVLRTLINEAFRTPREVQNAESLHDARERKFRELLATWYEDTMDRATGWYKRDAGKWLFWWGLLIALFLYADTIRLFRYFMNNSATRQIVTSQAVRFDAMPQAYKAKLSGADTVKQPLDTLQARLTGLLKTEINGLDTSHVFGWNLAKRKPKFDFVKYTATVDSLNRLKRKTYDPQELINNSFDSLKTDWEYRVKLRDRMNAMGIGAQVQAPPPSADISGGKKADQKVLDSLEILWKRQMALLETRAMLERQKIADTVKAADLALKAFQENHKEEKDAKRDFWPPWISDFIRKLRAGIGGMLLTALAVSFGAPFWFDFLTSLVKFRGSGGGPRLSGVKPEEKKA